MRVSIFTEGGADRGFGHLSRCGALEGALLANGNEVTVYYWGVMSAEAFFSSPSTIRSEWMRAPEDVGQLLQGADAAVFDSYAPATDFYQKALAKYQGVPVFFDDQARIQYPSGLIVNGAPGAESIYSPLREDEERLCGPQWQALRPAFQDCGTIEIARTVKKVMVTLGGDDIHSLAPQFYTLLTEAFPDWVFRFVTTGVSRTFSELSSKVRFPHSLSVDLDAVGMREAMLSSDLAITAAGQTTFETARVGLPVALVQVAQNQSFLIASWLKTGYVLNSADWSLATNPGVLAEMLSRLSPQETRMTVSRKGTSAVDGRGAQRIASRIEERWRNGRS